VRAVSGYRTVKTRKTGGLFLTALLLAAAFFAGAVAERTAHILQDIVTAAPAALDEFKAFLREKVVFKVKVSSAHLKLPLAATCFMAQEQFSCLIRGP